MYGIGCSIILDKCKQVRTFSGGGQQSQTNGSGDPIKYKKIRKVEISTSWRQSEKESGNSKLLSESLTLMWPRHMTTDTSHNQIIVPGVQTY